MARKRGAKAQDLIWRLEAFGFDVATAFLRLLPVDFASDAGAVALDQQLTRDPGPIVWAVRDATDLAAAARELTARPALRT